MDTSSSGSTTEGSVSGKTDRLIASDRVEGPAVYNRQNERPGTVHNFMADKETGRKERGRAAYAVMSFGGFPGIGESHHPLP